jgi:NADPH:quinone reductase-like Zn-dependent oxidoreductase
MKAIRLLEYGGQLAFNDVPTPTIARDEILVKIKSTAVNHLDLVAASRTAIQILTTWIGKLKGVWGTCPKDGDVSLTWCSA